MFLDWPTIGFVTEDDLERLMYLTLCRRITSIKHNVKFIQSRTKPGSSCMLDKHSTH